MADYLLDTHACIFALRDPKRLGARARSALRRVDQGKDRALVPAPVVAEILLLRERGRTSIGIPELREAFAATHWRFVALDLAELDEFAALAGLADPFDRLIVAAARHHGAKLVSRDAGIADSGLVEVVWG